MLTIRHIEPNGYETIYSCHSLWREPSPNQVKTEHPHYHQGAMVADIGDDQRRFSSGQLFVMNENGKTVAKYEWDLPA